MIRGALKLVSLVSVFLGATVLLSVPGCGRGSGKPKFAFITNNKYDFWIMAEQGTKAAAQSLDVDVEFRMGDGKAEHQQQLIEDLLNKGVKGIAISPVDAKGMESFFKNKVKVPLITQDSDVPDPAARKCYIGTHNYRAGRVAGKLVTEAAPQGGKIVIFVGQLDVQNAVERRQGVIDYLRDHGAGKRVNEDEVEIGELTGPTDKDIPAGKYTVVYTLLDDGKAENCRDRAKAFLGRDEHADVVCLVGLWEYNPPELLRARRGPEQKIVGFDENYTTLDAIKSKDIHATVVQNPFEFGKQAIEILHGLDKGDNTVLTKRKDIDSKNRIFMPHRVIVHDESAMLKASHPYGVLTPVLDVSTFYKEVKKNKGE